MPTAIPRSPGAAKVGWWILAIGTTLTTLFFIAVAHNWLRLPPPSGVRYARGSGSISYLVIGAIVLFGACNTMLILWIIRRRRRTLRDAPDSRHCDCPVRETLPKIGPVVRVGWGSNWGFLYARMDLSRYRYVLALMTIRGEHRNSQTPPT